MIQTQLLKLDPPYQIISAKGLVGIQVATMIEAREIELRRNRLGQISNYIEYHSYPVVNYGLKQGLEEEMKYNNNPTDEFAEYRINIRMQPEGAVWSGVEVKDVHVLGLVGAKNRAVTLDRFIYLIPTVPGFDPRLHVWDKKSTSSIYELYFGLGRVGIDTPKISGEFLNKNKSFTIELYLEPAPLFNGFFVRVFISQNNYIKFVWDESDDFMEFRCMLVSLNQESLTECAITITEALNGISAFLPTSKLDIVPIIPNNNQENSNAIKQISKLVEENYKGLRYSNHD